jgi:hypothetical protein
MRYKEKLYSDCLQHLHLLAQYGINNLIEIDVLL